MLNELCKHAFGRIAESWPLRPLIRFSAREHINVVYYHYVGMPEPHYGAFYGGCTLSRFREDLTRLSKVFDFVPLGEVLESSKGPRKGGRPSLAVTFDDGFDLGTNAFMELLAEFGAPATTFIVTGCINNEHLMWRHKLSAVCELVAESTWLPEFNELATSLGFSRIASSRDLMASATLWDMSRKDEWAEEFWRRCDLPPVEDYLAEKRPYFTWEGLRKWIGAGHSVGFHTHTHPFCARLGSHDIASELIGPAEELKRRLGISDLYMSYPFGDRLQAPVEHDLLAKGIFKALFGIRGFSKRTSPWEHLQRAGTETCDLGFAVFGRHLFGAVGLSLT